MNYRMNEIFESIQGEGRFSGYYATFIRFAGCNLSCPFCDTDHRPLYNLCEKQLIDKIIQYKNKIVIFTGGEPTLQIKPNKQGNNNLVRKLRDLGFHIHIETNGTLPIANNFDWVTISPKENWKQKTGDELKVVYQGQDLSQYDNTRFNYYYLQPCEKNGNSNIKETIKAIGENKKWILSLQTQKILGIK